MTKATGRLLTLALTGFIVIGCARQSTAPSPAAVATPVPTAPASANPAASPGASPAASPAATLQPLPSFDLGDLTAVDKALAGANDAISAANDPGSEGGSR